MVSQKPRFWWRVGILVAFIHPVSELCIYGPVFESVLKVLRRVKVLALLQFVVAQMSERKLTRAAGERGWRERVVGVTAPLSKTMAYLIFSKKKEKRWHIVPTLVF
jgi:hypothetical protein